VKDATGKIDMDKNAHKLIFVYNADSSVFSQVSDAVKKIVTPKLKSIKLPAIFISQNNTLNPLVSADEINIQKNIIGLKNIINGKIKSI